MKKIINKNSIYCSFCVITILIVSILTKSGIFSSVSAICGILYTILIANGKKEGYIFGIINVTIYGVIVYMQALYGTAFFQIIYCFPMFIFGYFKWKNVQSNTNKGIKTITKKRAVYLTLICVLVIFVYYNVLKYLNGKHVFFDSTSSVLSYVGIYLTTNKYIEQWIIWFIVNVLNSILWVILCITDISNLPILVMWLIYTINSVYGYFSWRRKI